MSKKKDIEEIRALRSRKAKLERVSRDTSERKQTEEALRESEKKYRSLFNNMLSGFAYCKILVDENNQPIDFIYLDINDAFERLTGLKKENVIGKKVTEAIPGTKESHPELFSIYGKVALTGEPTKFDIYFKPLRIWLTISVYSSQRGYFVAVFENITERKQAEEKIDRLAKFPEENPNPVLRIAKDGTILYANSASSVVLETWGCKKGQCLSGHWYQCVLDALSCGLSSCAECTEVRCDDRIFSLTFAPVADANYVNVYGLDITERKKAEERLLDRQAQLKSLAAQLTLAEEHERHRVANGLHDQISQSLASSKIELDALRHCVSPKDPDKALKEVSDSIGKAIGDMRSLTFDLSYPILYELGFEAAVATWLADRVEGKYGIKTEFEDDGQPKPLDEDVRVFLFRDVRELLMNVVKHAQTKRVKVSIRKVGRQIQVRVEDGGIGFDPEKVAATAVRKGGFGLFSIRERLEELGGHLEIESAPGHGTKATLIAPLKQEKISHGGQK